MRIILILCLAAYALFAAGKTADAEVQRKVAIIVENRADPSLNDKVATLEDLVTSRVAGKGFAIISRDVTLNALKTYSTAGITADVKSTATAKATLSPDHAPRTRKWQNRTRQKFPPRPTPRNWIKI